MESNFEQCYLVNLSTGQTLPVSGGVVVIDYGALDQHDSDVFDHGSDNEIIYLGERSGFNVDILAGGVI
jgi:hypothetical protein